MGTPRTGINATTHSVGFTAKLVTVTAISDDGATAVTVDRQNTQTLVTMLIQRSKAVPPQQGETWLITQDLGIWTFAAFVAPDGNFLTQGAPGRSGISSPPFITVGAAPPAAPRAGDVWMNSADGNEILTWTGTAWQQEQLGTGAFADGAVTAPKIAPGAITRAQIAPAAGITAGQVAFTASDIGGTAVIVGTAQPQAIQPGDLWINPANGNSLSVWDGHAWTAVQLSGIAIQPGSITPAQLASSVTARGIGGITTTISGVQPLSANEGDMWIDTAEGNQLFQFSAGAWNPIQWDAANVLAAGTVTAALIAAGTITGSLISAGTVTAANIAAGTITAAQITAATITGALIAAGTITAANIQAGTITGTQIAAAVSLTAPVIAGGTITGSQIVSDGTGKEFLVYSGTPALGNLVASNVSAAFTDTPGNYILPGLVTYYYATAAGVLSRATQVFNGTVFYYSAANSTLGPWTQVASVGGNYGGALAAQGLVLTETGLGQVMIQPTTGAAAALEVKTSGVTATVALTASAGETISAGGLAVTGGTTTDTILVTGSAQFETAPTASHPGSPGTAETWQTLGGWSGGNVLTGTGRYRVTLDGELEIEINGTFSITGSPTLTMPAGYQIAHSLWWPAVGSTGCSLNSTTGSPANQLQVNGVTSAVTVGFCQRIPMN